MRFFCSAAVVFPRKKCLSPSCRRLRLIRFRSSHVVRIQFPLSVRCVRGHCVTGGRREERDDNGKEEERWREREKRRKNRQPKNILGFEAVPVVAIFAGKKSRRATPFKDYVASLSLLSSLSLPLLLPFPLIFSPRGRYSSS